MGSLEASAISIYDQGEILGSCGDLLFNCAPGLIYTSQRSHRRRADTVATHMHLLGFGKGLAIGAVADDVVAREALGLVQLSRLQHPQADIDDYIRCAFDGHRDECQAVAGGDGGGRHTGIDHPRRGKLIRHNRQ